ncbi:MAG: molybdopterin-binding protein [Tissierellia bacterium]|nr:molybdopterin-binding protein [Tissierellia bacterium]
MKEIKTEDAVGMVLCHDLTQIIKDEYKGSRFKKGHVVKEEDIPVLLSMGKEHLYVWENDEDLLHENDAAKILAEISMGENTTTNGKIAEGKITITSKIDGLLKIDANLLERLNDVEMVMIATKRNNIAVKKYSPLASMRVIPLVVKKELMKKCQNIAGNNKILSIKPFIGGDAIMIATGEEIKKGRIEDTFSPVLTQKVKDYNYDIKKVIYPGDDVEIITRQINEAIENGAKAVFCSGGMSVDPDDNTPLAIRNASDEVITYGAPVLPGAMFMLAYKNNVPIIGLPGCVMYAKKTVFDLLIPRISAGEKLCKKDIVKLGMGGLL